MDVKSDHGFGPGEEFDMRCIEALIRLTSNQGTFANNENAASSCDDTKNELRREEFLFVGLMLAGGRFATGTNTGQLQFNYS
jgi:hypothetical protein